MIVSLLSACGDKEEVDVGCVIDFVNKGKAGYEQAAPATDSLLKYNIAMDFTHVYAYVKAKLNALDGSSCNTTTKQYIKCLVLADLVHAAFSVQYSGGILDTFNCVRSYAENDHLSAYYAHGNSNDFAVNCDGRTNYFIKLVDTLLGIKAYPVSVKSIHTFPLVVIGGSKYLVDPGNPAVLIDGGHNSIIDFDRFVNRDYKTLSLLPTGRIFGNSKDLVTHFLYAKIAGDQKNTQKEFAAVLDDYVMKNNEQLKPFEKYTKIYGPVPKRFWHIAGRYFSGVLMPSSLYVLQTEQAYRYLYLGEQY
ncbi:MAG: hypothetical protein V4658_08140 [Bacteroidota bacterium]